MGTGSESALASLELVSEKYDWQQDTMRSKMRWARWGGAWFES